jgi:hypothetical protein
MPIQCLEGCAGNLSCFSSCFRSLRSFSLNNHEEDGKKEVDREKEVGQSLAEVAIVEQDEAPAQADAVESEKEKSQDKTVKEEDTDGDVDVVIDEVNDDEVDDEDIEYEPTDISQWGLKIDTPPPEFG